MASRSITGCYTCKTRRKKCDETHPQCQRCTKLGLECGGYEYVKGRDGKTRKRRTIPAPRATSESTTLTGTAATPTPSDSQHTSDLLSNLLDPLMAVPLLPAATPTLINLDQILDPNYDASLEQASVDSLVFPPLPDSYDHPVVSLASSPNIHCSTCPQPAQVENWQLDMGNPSVRTRSPTLLYGTNAQSCSTTPCGGGVGELNLGQASLLQTLDPTNLLQPPPLLLPLPQSNLLALSSHWPSVNTDEDDDSEDDNPEGVTQILCSGPVMDSSVTSNMLPFVLQSYANWMKLVSFDPARNARQTKDALIHQISGSEMARSRITLIANAMKVLHDKSPLDPQAVKLTLMLTAAVRRAALFYQTSPRARNPDLDRQSALRVLDNIIEVVAIQTYSMSLASSIDLIECVAPVFRRACPDPPEMPINLCNILLDSDANLRYFAITDIWLSSTTGRPMLLRYDVDFSVDLCKTMESRRQDFGLQWLHGIPSQFMLLMAFMNQLKQGSQARGHPVSEDLITKIEGDIKNLKNYSEPIEDRDPVMNLRRLAIRECCHQAAYVYLYMALGGASADDLRVKSAHRTFIRLVNAVKPGRNPDTFLTLPWIIVGVATRKQRDRDALYQRLYPLPECGLPGTSGHDAIRMLSDVWLRTESEGRPAVWNDMRIACLRITGM